MENSQDRSKPILHPTGKDDGQSQKVVHPTLGHKRMFVKNYMGPKRSIFLMSYAKVTLCGRVMLSLNGAMISNVIKKMLHDQFAAYFSRFAFRRFYHDLIYKVTN